MTPSLKMFLVVAEEMSISKAAARSFVTQQCVSDHIKRLEDEYGVVLFKRRPRLSLTQEGKVMLKVVKEMENLEEKLKLQLENIKENRIEKLVIGINATRINILLPKLLPIYHKLYPNVIISFVRHETRELEQMLLKGSIDMFVGVNTHTNPQFRTVALGTDKLHILLSAKMVEKYFSLDEETIRNMRKGLNFSQLKDIPFVGNFEGSTLNELVNYYTEKSGIELNNLYYTGDYDTQIALCTANLAAVACPTMILNKVLEYNKKVSKDEKIYIFPLNNQSEELKIELISNREVETTPHGEKFAELLKDEIEDNIDTLKEYLDSL
ncbi:LysR family transcriptional regulator [uncultured Fusobacterium sp.]|jgi:DNA-binding transcriptional LysR family regulator|uniref:LysR family transcriptional regulator n=1 Tax=uncultured Fusobacterium sp. TaxID=159267 RepID=UPI002805CFCB|nr:LysR family transcriptional regulator [uncultured Fusobacterium sp.]